MTNQLLGPSRYRRKAPEGEFRPDCYSASGEEWRSEAATWMGAAAQGRRQLSRLCRSRLPETFGYTLKRKLLGPPLVNEQMQEQRLSRPLALGVLSCDGISSAAYGTEEC